MPIWADIRTLTSERMRFVVFSTLWALMASAMLVESDVYRYVTIVLVVFALVWRGADVRSASRDWLALLCYAWSAYAAVRFGFGLMSGQKGASEWLYIFPVFFPLVGAALFATRHYIFPAVTLFVLSGLVCLLLTFDLPTLISGERATPLFHHNPIHAGIGAGMLALTSIFWMFYAAETRYFRGWFKWPILGLGTVTFILSLIGVLGAQSKGAWLALVAIAVFSSFISLLCYAGRRRLYVLGALLFVMVVATTIALPYVNKVAGKTADASIGLTTQAVYAKPPLVAIQSAIENPETPEAMRERLMLWSNAIELIEAAPWVGWGNLWLREWSKTTYADVGYTLMHNGYLEIMIRHGIFGIAFLLVFCVVAAQCIHDARCRGVISSSLAAYLYSISFFFFCTIATNSNNRLALGESFFIFTAAAVFAIRLASREAQARNDASRSPPQTAV